GLGASDEQYQLAAPRRATPTRMLTIRRMASLPLSLPIPGYRGSRCEIEVQDPGGGLTLDPLARDRVAEEGDFEGGVDLGLARLPVEPAVERQKLVEGRSLDGRSRQDREGAQRRGPCRRDQDAAAERLVRRDPRTAVGALVMNGVALAHHVGEPLGILLARVLQVALEVHRRDLDRSDDPDVDETRLELEVHR